MELQNLLNKSEQSRRELEIQVSSSKAREEEFHLAFGRAKEQVLFLMFCFGSFDGSRRFRASMLGRVHEVS